MSWRSRAACKDVSFDVFFPEKYRQSPTTARRICAACPVRMSCLEEAMRVEDTWRYGIYGGLTPTERGELAKRRQHR